MGAVSAAFITQWGSEFQYKFQQTDSRLRGTVYSVSGVGSTYSFPRMESSAAITGKSRHSDLTAANVDLDRISATPIPIYWTEYLDNIDAVRNNADVRGAYTDVGVAAVNRAIDQQVLTAMATGGTAVSISNTLNSAGLIAIAQQLNTADVDMGDRYGAISPGALNDITSDTKFTSRDYVAGKLFETGSCPNVLGFTLNMTNLLAVPSGGQRRCYFYHKRSVGLHILEDLSMRLDYVATKDAWQVMVKAMVGAVIIRPESLFYADIAD